MCITCVLCVWMYRSPAQAARQRFKWRDFVSHRVQWKLPGLMTYCNARLAENVIDLFSSSSDFTFTHSLQSDGFRWIHHPFLESDWLSMKYFSTPWGCMNVKLQQQGSHRALIDKGGRSKLPKIRAQSGTKLEIRNQRNQRWQCR